MKMMHLAFLVALTASCAAQKPFDGKRDPLADLAEAKTQASAEHKYIFLDFGGNWCPPCLLLDAALHDDPSLSARMAKSFVLVRVEVGVFFSSKKAKELRSQFPKFNRYPHLLILDPRGAIVHEEVVGDLRANADGKGIDHAELARFLDRWSPTSGEPAGK